MPRPRPATTPRRPRSRTLTAALPLALVGLLVGGGALPASVAAPVPEDQLVTEVPASRTPDVLDGVVYSVVRTGGVVVLGGDFDRARPADERGEGDGVPVGNLLAFDPATGDLEPGWPAVDGRVEVVRPTADGTAVWVGGRFDTIGGVERRNLALVRVSDGEVLPWSAGAIDGEVADLRLVAGRLWLAGKFTTVQGTRQPALATLDAGTGRLDRYQDLAVAGTHQEGQGSTGVRKIDVTPSGDRLVAVGNFRSVGGEVRRQLAVLDLRSAGVRLAPWRTTFFAEQCAQVFDSYVKDVDLSPDGSWFAVVTTGAAGGADSACDSATRFETRARGAVRPTWIANTGGDTTWAVEADDGIVYTGGHFRWQNNPLGRNFPGDGAVARVGLAALDARNGLPLDWNPTRTRNEGVFDFLRTPEGLYVASDTDRIGQGQFLRGRIALLPAGGAVVPAQPSVRLPGEVLLLGGKDSSRTRARTLKAGGRAARGTRTVGLGADWDGLGAAFVHRGRIFAGWRDGSFTVQDLGDDAVGPRTPVDAAEQIEPLEQWHTELRSITGMVFDDGRIYYTLRGADTLWSRAFTPYPDASGGVVAPLRRRAASGVRGFDPRQVRSLMIGEARGQEHLYWRTPKGALKRIEWTDAVGGSRPVARTAERVGPRRLTWRAAALVLREG